jgi:hypothetical protein
MILLDAGPMVALLHADDRHHQACKETLRSLVRVAERERIHQVFPLDRRDFSLYRPEGLERFQILPEA